MNAQQNIAQLWQQQPVLTAIAAIVAGSDGEVRIVGGALRDALLGRPVGDIDLACNLPPGLLMDIFAQAKVKTVPIGLAHGTLTVVMKGQGFEITSLRRDVATDGRRAQVAFTDDWQADAARRDFTFNALYLSREGKLYDYFGGQADLAAGKVCFVGQPSVRIREDILRILRFYRFYAWFGQGAPDPEALDACAHLAHLLPQLSAERVWREWTKLLLAPDPLPAVRLMRDHGALAQILPEAVALDRLEALLQLERRYAIPSSALRRTAALLPYDGKIAQAVAARLKLSTREADSLFGLAQLPRQLERFALANLRRVIYAHGIERAYDAMLLAAANASVNRQPPLDIASALVTIAGWSDPHFPLRGDDMLALGLTPGPKMGTVLQAVEAWWIDRDFAPTRAECLDEANRRILTRV